jgi:hypothetical protein
MIATAVFADVSDLGLGPERSAQEQRLKLLEPYREARIQVVAVQGESDRATVAKRCEHLIAIGKSNH